jgi:hypothetical protein
MVRRPPAVAGLFYPADAEALRDEVDRLLAEAAVDPRAPAPKALISPHAGLVYSGPVAASAFVRLRAAAARIERVVLLGPAHRVPLRGLGLPDADAFSTPLGDVPVDGDGARALERAGLARAHRAAHAGEHSLEVELPFLQRLLPGEFSLLPLVVGDAKPEEVAAAIDAVWGGDETAVVVSSDLSHYLAYEDARRMDEATARRIVALDAAPLDHQQACGAEPVNGLVHTARSRRMRVEQLDLRSSGDTAGDRGRVVGYGAFAFHQQAGVA